MYEVLPPSPLAQVIARETGYSIKILYEQPGQPPEQLDSVYVQYLRFSNIGRVPIMREDVVNAIRVQVEGPRVLDVAIYAAKRPESEIAIGVPSTIEKTCTAELDFKFLDFEDGGVVQIVTVDPTRRITLEGAVLVMPRGIRQVGVDTPSRQRALISRVGFGAALLLGLLTLALMDEVFQSIIRAPGVRGGGLIFAIALVAPVIFVATLYGFILVWRKATGMRDSRLRNALLEPPGWYSKRGPRR